MALRDTFRRLLRAEDGGATVEFTLLVPAFLGIVLFAADTATSFSRQSNIWSVSQQTARIVARHGMEPEAAAAFARHNLRIGDYMPEVAVTLDDRTQSVTVVVTAATAELAPFGVLSRALTKELTVSVSQALEPI